jgi:hypothetical protein
LPAALQKSRLHCAHGRLEARSMSKTPTITITTKPTAYAGTVVVVLG